MHQQPHSSNPTTSLSTRARDAVAMVRDSVNRQWEERILALMRAESDPGRKSGMAIIYTEVRQSR